MQAHRYGKVILIAAIFCAVRCTQQAPKDVVLEEEELAPLAPINAKPKLSDYGFFDAPLKQLKAQGRVFPYDVNAQLFTDYALKKRFIMLPKGSVMNYHAEDVFEFPIGTVLIKNFFYPADFREPEENIRLLETRLLIRESETWQALTYVWNEEQADAYLEVGGSTIPVRWISERGKEKSINYLVPNMNQCKSCHQRGDKLSPIGPSARQLNNEHGQNQLEHWSNLGLLAGLPSSNIPRLASYADESKSIDQRARAWLEVNCGHCHREDGPAKTSGLHLLATGKNQFELGIGKPPVAAGKGSGGLKYDIVPGKPEESILYYRIQSVDPGVMMPELGRTIVHQEGLQIIEDWIRSLR